MNQRYTPYKIIFVFFFIWMIVLPHTAYSHSLKFGLLEITEQGNNCFQVFFKYAGAKKNPVAAEVLFPKGCTPISPVAIDQFPYTRSLRWDLAAPDGLAGKRITITGITEKGAQVVVRYKALGQPLFEKIITSDNWELTLPDVKSADTVVKQKSHRFSIMKQYIIMGIRHILNGWDHLLFVMALVWLIFEKPPLVLIRTITAFTIGHSITLSLAAIGKITLPGPPVGAVIALSIIYLAYEMVKNEASVLIRRRPELVSAGFGLFHGLGFAGVLQNIGLPEDALITSLFSFNVGIEIGQILFILVLIPVLSTEKKLSIPGFETVIAYGIGTLASFWWIERSLSILGII